jgi:phosphatidylserine decarboxylase
MSEDTRPGAGADPGEGPVFAERLSGLFAPDVYTTAMPLLFFGFFGIGMGSQVGAGFWLPGLVLTALGVFCAAFFRNPPRQIPGDERTVISPADGKVIEAGLVELPDGRKAQRVGIFLSVFNVHINRAPLAGRVVGFERSGDKFLAAFNPDARTLNVQTAMECETALGERFTVVQITGLIARRIVCQPVVGEWLVRGVRYGLIRFGSRTDVILPAEAELLVEPGQKVSGGSSILGRMPGARETETTG